MAGKVDRHGAAAVLTEAELDALLEAAPGPRHRCLWSIQRWTAARIGEALQLRWGDVNGSITFRKGTTKAQRTRQVPMGARLGAELERYREAWAAEHSHPPAKDEVLFPAKGSTTSPMTRQAADLALRKTCAELGLEGVSTHSFRRSTATSLVRRGTPLHVIQRVTGHQSLGSLGHYLEPGDGEVLEALRSLEAPQET